MTSRIWAGVTEGSAASLCLSLIQLDRKSGANAEFSTFRVWFSFFLLERQIYEEKERQRKIIHLLVHSPNALQWLELS